MRILDNKVMKIVLVVVGTLLLNMAGFIFSNFDIKGNLTLEYTIKAEEPDRYQLFYSNKEDWSEQNSIIIDYNTPNIEQVFIFNLPKDIRMVRLDLGGKEGKVILSNISINYLWKTIDISNKILTEGIDYHDITSIKKNDNSISIESKGNDPFIAIDLTNLKLKEIYKVDNYISYTEKILVCITIDILLIIFIKKRKIIKGLGEEVYNNKTLIWNLSKNDFKTKYAGSYLGIIWAFIQPIVTVLVYWFVFQVGFKSAPVADFPFVLWLVSGIVPWFFFSEALTNATNSMIEYSYLVKKVVFKISILPIVKIISALFVHTFFMCFTIILFAIYGYIPDMYVLQVIYYSFCMIIFILGISYATCAIVIFFKDLSQIIGIFLQVGMWMTPIMWSYTIMPQKYQWILKINPMYYIVEGYRDALINKVWFWSRFNQTIYFWIIAIGLFAIGSLIFKRLKVHFADVL